MKQRLTIRMSNYHSECLEYLSNKLGITYNAIIQVAVDRFINDNLLDVAWKRKVYYVKLPMEILKREREK